MFPMSYVLYLRIAHEPGMIKNPTLVSHDLNSSCRDSTPERQARNGTGRPPGAAVSDSRDPGRQRQSGTEHTHGADDDVHLRQGGG